MSGTVLDGPHAPRRGTGSIARERVLRWEHVPRAVTTELVERAARGDAGLVIRGPAGSGKSTLLGLLADGAVPADSHVLRLAGSPSFSQIPWAAFARLEPGTSTDAHAVLRVLWRQVTDEAAGRPLVLLVDDAQHLDDASAELVYHLAAFASARVFAAVRGNDAPDAVVALSKDGLCEDVFLPPLTRAETATLLAAALGGRVEGASALELWTITQGNLLFLRELVRDALDDGSLRQLDNLWTWDGSCRTESRLSTLVATRTSKLRALERDALDLIALGEPLDLDVVLRVCDADVVESLERHQLLRIARDGASARVHVEHPAIAEVVRGSLPAAAAVRLRRVLVDALSRAPLGELGDRLRLAAWQLELGEPTSAAALLEAARWFASSDARRALQIAGAAVDAGAGAEGHRLRATLLAIDGRAADAAALLAEAGATATTTTDRGALALAEAEVVLCEAGDVSAAAALVAGVDPADAPVVRDALDRWIELQRGELPEVPIVADPGGEGGGPRPPAWATAAALRADLARGAVTDAASGAGRFLTDTVSAGTDDSVYAVAHARYLARWAETWDRGVAAVLPAATRDYEAAIATRSRLVQGPAALLLGELLLLGGAVDEAMWSLSEAAITVGARGYLHSRCLDSLAIALALMGEIDAARSKLDLADASEANAGEVLAHERAAAIVDAAAGNESAALARLRRALSDPSPTAPRTTVLLVAHDLARLGDPLGAGRVLERAPVEGTLAALLVAHVRAIADRRPHALLSIATELEAHGLYRFAAEAELLAASRFMQEGQRSASAAASQRASALLARCGPLSLGTSLPLTGATLTRRELQVSELAAAGMRDQQIGQQLGLSVRTVQTHLHRAYCKLGVHGRDALASALAALGSRD